MLTKPDITDKLIIARLHEDYDLHVANITFLPLGADEGSAVYRVVANDGTACAYFLKLRKGFDEIIVTVPLFLKSQSIQEIIAPFESKSKQGWADFGKYKMILYPFIEGKNGFEAKLTDHHKRTLGSALRQIHSVRLKPDLELLIPKETFSPLWRERMKSFQHLAENQSFDDNTASKLAEFTRSKRKEINHLIERAETLALELQSQPLEFILCHTDIHGGNILISDKDKLYIVDWDAPLLAPKERDLMFIGGGIDAIWKIKREEALFYEGYGKTEVNITALAYYRYERIIEDLVAFCEQLLLTNEGGADRERSYGWFRSNFEPGATIEIADKTYNLLS
jgi:spectinomycin phosphotransferase